MDELLRLRRKMAAFMVVFICLHLPVVMLMAWLGQRDILAAGSISLALNAAALGAWLADRDGLSTRMTLAATLIGQVSVMVYILAGHPWQADMHMYYFAVIAILAIFCDGRVVLMGAAVTAVHHLVLNFIFPAAVFAGGSDLARVMLHAVIVVLETGALVWMCLMLADKLILSARTLATLEEKAKAEADHALALRTQRETQEAKERAVRLTLAEQFETRIGQIARHLADQATVMQKSAATLATSVATVAEASEGMIRDSATANDDALAAAEAAAAATQEIHLSIQEIGAKIDETVAVSQKAVHSAAATGQRVQQLAEAADKIGAVIRLIQEIANQTNLLALNATIEAARAGDAGKGFAIVASEVKALATQTARATEDIQRQVSAIQSETDGAVDAISGIGGVISDINRLVGSVAAAVHQQGAVTGALAGRVDLVAQEVATATDAVSAISGESQAARQVADTLLGVAQTLSEQTEKLRGDVDHFLSDVRTDAQAA